MNENLTKALLEQTAVNSKILRPHQEDAPAEHFYILNRPENSERSLLLSQPGL